MKARNLPSHIALLLAGALLITGCATTASPPPSADIANLDRFCIQSQADISAAKVPATVVLHTEYQSFVESKPAARPLRTEQYIWYVDEAAFEAGGARVYDELARGDIHPSRYRIYGELHAELSSTRY